MQLQEAFPGKPTYVGEQSVVTLSLPEIPTKEKQEVRMVLGDLNNQWEDRFGHSYSSVVAKMVPEANLRNRVTKAQQKKQNRVTKRKIVDHINKQFAENQTLTVLVEGESMQAYKRKRYAMSFEKPTSPSKRIKLHSPSDSSQTWSHEDATALPQSHPPNVKICWDQSARHLYIPGKNAGQVLKEYAIKQGFNVLSLECKSSPPPKRIRRTKKKLPGRKISTPSLPTPAAIRAEKQEFIANGILSIGEPCSPYKLTRTVVTKEGEVQTKECTLVHGKKAITLGNTQETS